MPRSFLWYQKTWLKFNPGWEIKIWNEENIESLKEFKIEDFNKLVNWSEKSDYLRIIILLEYGWIYIDTDMECLQNIEKIIENLTFFAWKDSDGTVINTAIVWANKNNRIIKIIFGGFHSQIKKFWRVHDFNKIGPFYVTKVIKKIQLNKHEKIFDENVFYPISGREYYDWIQINREKLRQDWSYGIHHYTYSWSRILFLKRKYLYKYVFLRKILESYISIKNKIWKFRK